MLSSLTYSHIREEMKYSRADWLRQAKSESTTVWESYEKQICTLGQSVQQGQWHLNILLFTTSEILVLNVMFWHPRWNVWSDMKQSIVILCSLRRKMPPRSSTITANKPNFLTYIGMEQLSHILPLKNISLMLNTSWEKLSLWYVYTKLLE